MAPTRPPRQISGRAQPGGGAPVLAPPAPYLARRRATITTGGVKELQKDILAQNRDAAAAGSTGLPAPGPLAETPSQGLPLHHFDQRMATPRRGSNVTAAGAVDDSAGGAAAAGRLPLPPEGPPPVTSRIRGRANTVMAPRPISFAGTPSAAVAATGSLGRRGVLPAAAGAVDAKPLGADRCRAASVDVDGSNGSGGAGGGRRRHQPRELSVEDMREEDAETGSRDGVAGSADDATGAATTATGRAPRTLRFTLNTGTTSTRDAESVLGEVMRGVGAAGLLVAASSGYFVTCRTPGGDVEFEVEVCRIPRLNLHGLRFRRMAGSPWTYKSLMADLVSRLNL
ncbi:hypothetical protein HK405_002421 [Cladochytrium tenue]|nr:hypothetical protein HK405_002421 [Cladochytrium tenue]